LRRGVIPGKIALGVLRGPVLDVLERLQENFLRLFVPLIGRLPKGLIQQKRRGCPAGRAPMAASAIASVATG
jgi:hypothetical protein